MSPFRAIPKSRPLPEIVLDEFRRLIAEGMLRSGEQLPSEIELAESLGVGRSSVREAMRALQLLGVVEVIQGKGSFVRDPAILPLMVDWARIASMSVISEVMEARQFIEVALAQLAAERATDDDIAAIRAALEHSRDSVGDLPHSVEAGVNFHLALADAAHNEVLAHMYRAIRDLYIETARRTRITPAIAEGRLHDHEKLLQAIVNHDPQAAAQTMKAHLDKAYQILSTSESEPPAETAPTGE